MAQRPERDVPAILTFNADFAKIAGGSLAVRRTACGIATNRPEIPVRATS